MRTITVRGTGKVSVPPDTIELRLTLEAKDMEYAAAMEKAAGRIEALQGAILAAGIGMLAFGIARGELLVIFQKAALICLECIGIG